MELYGESFIIAAISFKVLSLGDGHPLIATPSLASMVGLLITANCVYLAGFIVHYCHNIRAVQIIRY
ncbi:hypothetical protein [Sporomusa paucivorans]|uniref:hypothetical protein n=1 Tax=Sporomusa paucivorans TaxID=2376 RepID=UPI003570A9E6